MQFRNITIVLGVAAGLVSSAPLSPNIGIKERDAKAEAEAQFPGFGTICEIRM